MCACPLRFARSISRDGGIGLGGLSVSAFGSYTPAIVVVTLVVLVGGLAQLRMPRQTTVLTRGSALSSPRHAGDS